MSKSVAVDQITDAVSRANIEAGPAVVVDDVIAAVRKEALSGTTVKKAGRKIKSMTGVEVTTAETRAFMEMMFACVFEEAGS